MFDKFTSSLSSDESASKRAYYLTKALIQTASSSTNLEGMHPSERILIKQYQLLEYKVSNIWKCILVSNILLQRMAGIAPELRKGNLNRRVDLKFESSSGYSRSIQ
jgi:hypothetical protein